MGKKTKVQTEVQVQAKEAQAQEAVQPTEAKARAEVNAMPFIKSLHLEWLWEGTQAEGANIAAIVSGKLYTDVQGREWISWTLTYKRADGTGVPGLIWGVSAPVEGGVIIMRLIEGGQVRATIKAWPTGKALITGEPDIVQALKSRPDLPAWTAKDTAALL
jgi:hypothetical protein